MPLHRVFAFLLLSLCSIAFAQAPQIKSGATVYIEPMDGYETYLAAAIAKKKVPLIVLADKSKAEYIITSSVSHQTPGQPTVVVNSTNINNNDIKDSNVNNAGGGAFADGVQRAEARRAARGTTSASISVIDAHSSQIVFAYSVGKSANTNQIQGTAEACAKHLKEFIERPGK